MTVVARCRIALVAAAAAGAAAVVSAADLGGFRPLAPGVLTVIPAPAAPPGEAAASTDTVSYADLVDITVGRADLAWKPLQSPLNTTLVERGRGRECRRDVWNLEFAFKPPRLIDVEVPAGNLKLQRKRLWYLVYRVRNAGGRRQRIKPDDGRRTAEAFETPIRFVPQFVLESLEPVDEGEGIASYRAYLDRVIPSALEPIRAREGGGRELLDSAAMAAEEIGPGEERWGVATWEDVDPRIDFFSIYVRGLTNAFAWRPRAGARIAATDPPGAAMEQALRTLRIDFWQPGDGVETAVGFAGMFERMTLGSRLLEAVGSERADAADPVAGLRALGLTWSDLLEPAEVSEPAGGDAGVSLLPLAVVIRKLASLPDADDRATAARAIFGDVGVVAFGELLRALTVPVDDARDAERRAAFEAVGLAPDEVAARPLAALATIVDALERERTATARRVAAARFCGPAGGRVEPLARQAALARTLATLEALEVTGAEIAAGDSRAAFDAIVPAIEAEADAARRSALLGGLFGARGPQLFAAAAAVNEGIDHSWVFRYENQVAGPEPAG